MNGEAAAQPDVPAAGQPLARLMAWRLAAVAGVALVVLASLLALFYTQLHERSAQQRLAETLRHYEARTRALDDGWLREADVLRAQMAFSELLDGTDADMRNARLSAFFTSLGGRGRFNHLALLDGEGRTLFSDNAGLVDLAAPGARSQLDWVYSAEQQVLYRSVRLPVRIAQKRGQLVLLAPADNALLGAQVVPDTTLSLIWAGNEVATSAHVADARRRASDRGLQRTEGRIRWAGANSPGPELRIVRSFALPIGATELLVMVAAAGAVATLLGWLVFGRWLSRHVARLATLEKVTTEFSDTRKLTPEFERRVGETIRGASREMHRLAHGLRSLMREVAASDAAQQQARQVLGELNANLEERVGQRTQELAQARDAALAAARAKEQFLANMSHELRTPLSGLLGALELMRDADRADERRRLLDVADQSAKALLAVINDVLDYSKIEAGKFELAAQPLRPDVLMAEVESLFSASAERKGLVLRSRCDPAATGCWVEGDSMRLRQVLLNLVGNALKFTDCGQVELRLTVLAQEPGQVRLRFEVEDSGIGMDPAVQARLFQAFSQGDPSDRRLRGGTGLGLAICQRLVHFMGGTIDVSSAPGSGSTFGFTLQLPRAWPVAPAVAGNALSSATLTGHVLLVEDNAVNRVIAVAMLQQCGLRVDECHNGAQAVEFLDGATVDLVLMDCQMPVLDGLAATSLIRARETSLCGRRLPIIALTANALQGDAERCRAAGMDGYLSKPFTRADLLRALMPWLGAAATAQGTGQAASGAGVKP